jgi:leucyl/phenylalanyl-tRNA---protein transferase
MPIFALDKSLVFPPVHLSEPDGLLAIGGDLSRERLLLAYRQGIFPWYEGPDILWWCPDPRFVLFPEELKVSKTMKSLIRKGEMQFTTNTAFGQVIENCKSVSRRGQDGTWISTEVKRAYEKLHVDGYAHSAETWFQDKLVGGLYGIRMGNVFFGESMFSTMSNASKFAFINYVEVLKREGVHLIDCQVYTQHLESLGARMIPRADFISMLDQFIHKS